MPNEARVAIVTGGSRGIGRAIALRLARDGFTVAVFGRTPATLDEVVGQITREGGRALAVRCDVSNYEETQAAVAAVHRELGSIDLLVNNAGIGRSKPFIETDEALWDELIDINYKGFLCATRACLPYMVEQQRGNIISMGSNAGRVGTGGEVVYGGTKAAIAGSTKALAREVARHNIRVNCVSPGPVQTDLLAQVHDEEKGKLIAKAIPMKRLGLPEDVAKVVSFFASDDAGYVTGQILSVDGGLTMIG
ncbi:MAG: SDR family NAD(P)-dependent oxidoreductase [Deferrisomatales bacterium]